MRTAASVLVPARLRGDDERSVLAALAARVWHLCPDRRDPERFHIEKDAIERELRQLARAWDPR